MKKLIYIILVVAIVSVCGFFGYKYVTEKYANDGNTEKNGKVDDEKVISTPFGSVLKEDADTVDKIIDIKDVDYDLPDIEKAGQLIVLTVEGRETFYELNRKALGIEYLLAENFARKQGLFIRGELCKDTAELIDKLHNGIGDFIAVPLPKKLLLSDSVQLVPAGAWKEGAGIWAVRKNSPKLKAALDKWYKSDYRNIIKSEEQMLVMTHGVQRHYYAPVYNRKLGKLSVYDIWFKKYSDVCNWDWRLLAAQCYQESMFDPEAQSFAGACGLMQLMPQTAKNLGLTSQEIFDPEKNIFAAARLIKELTYAMGDIPGRENRIKFVLACYNGGILHIRDAQALARADSMWNYKNWEALTPYILRLQDPQYYTNDSIVKNGYMRGSETVGYVRNIFKRWAEYRGIAKPTANFAEEKQVYRGKSKSRGKRRRR